MTKPMRLWTQSGILQTIDCPFNFYNRWVCEDHPEVQTAVGHLLHSYDRNKYESMARVVDTYNTSVRERNRLLKVKLYGLFSLIGEGIA